MSSPRSGPLFVVLLACAAAWLLSVRPLAQRAVLPAVEAEAFAALAGRSPAAASELWERLKAMGVAAVILREETAAELAARGEILYFSRAEAEKLRALGLVAAGAGPKPDSVWAKDAKALSRLSSALAARGIEVSTAAAGRSLELPRGVDLASVPVGFDPDTVAALSAAGLIPAAASAGPAVSIAGHRFWIRTLPASAGEPELLRAVFSRFKRLLILRPRAGADLEESLGAVRASLRVVKSAGLPLVPPAPAEAEGGGRFGAGARLVLFYALGLVGPLLAARAGLRVERGVSSWVAARAPIAAPVPEILAGLAAVWAAASAAGVLAASLLTPEAREAWARGWTTWTLGAPMAVAVAALFAGEGRVWMRRWRSPVRVRDLAAALALALAAACLLAPRSFLRIAGIWESVDRLSAAANLLWWWPWRWREILVGAPSMVVALTLLDSRQPGPQRRGPRVLSDPRAWLVLGLFAPAGTVAAIGAGSVPVGMAVAQAGAAFAMGAAVGFALCVLRTRIDAWVQRPIDPGLLT